MSAPALALKLEDGLLHPKLVRDLAGIANDASDIEEAYWWVKRLVNNAWWDVYRGGSHIALIWKGGVNKYRCAMIYEAKDELKGGGA